MTKQKTSPNFLQEGQTFITKNTTKAYMLNEFFSLSFKLPREFIYADNNTAQSIY